MVRLGTFSIVARCDRTGMLGMAVATAVPAAASLCSFVQKDAGAIATQSWVNPYLGIDGLRLLAAGASAQRVLDEIVGADPGRDDRQVGIVDASGAASAFTGKACVDWAGHVVGSGFAVQGNMLTGAATVAAMAEVADRERGTDLPERLMRVLEAGQAAGGDKRGRQSAALRVFHLEEFPYCDVRVDEHDHPVGELRRVLEVVKRQLLPFVRAMPTRDEPRRAVPDEVLQMLGKPPAER
jgi:uncharacterized Ntn-hydrolase superfamily protein